MNAGKTAAEIVSVRVLASRSFSQHDEAGNSTHYRAGDELELPADEAKQLVADGFVERAK